MRKTIIPVFFACFLASCAPDTIDSKLHDGFLLNKDKKYTEAIYAYTDAIKLDHKLQLAYYNRGQCYFSTKDYAKALADFDTVMALQAHSNSIVTESKQITSGNADVSYNEALYQRAQVYFYMDSMNSSFQDFQLLIDNNYEEKITCMLWQGSIWEKTGEKEKACDYFFKAKQLALKDADKNNVDTMIAAYCNQLKNPYTSDSITQQ